MRTEREINDMIERVHKQAIIASNDVKEDPDAADCAWMLTAQMHSLKWVLGEEGMENAIQALEES